MPQLGESVVEGTVSRWLKREGEAVSAYEPLLEVSTDKVDTEIPAPAEGVLLKVYVGPGETVERGALLGVIGAVGDRLPENGQTDASEPAERLESPLAPPERPPHITPVVARMAAEHHLDLSQIPGTGKEGRVTKKDVEGYLAARPSSAAATPDEPAPWEQPGSGDLFKPSTDDLEDPPVSSPSRVAAPVEAADERIPLTPMRRQIAEHMVRSKLKTAPHVTTVFEADLSRVVRHREAHKAAFARHGLKLTYSAYFVAATAKALADYPVLNGEWHDDYLLLHRRIHMGVAVAVEDGLLVPVIHDTQDLNLSGIARVLDDLASRARARQLRPDDVTGGTFTITNHGVSGSLFATPIIHQPQVGILGVGAIEKRVKVIDDAIAIRPCAYVALSFDHRALDGATGDAFLAALKSTLENWPDP
jgi:2-oxoglutarate dehydrogenase E2 component (dihydrolipoamide succinyltransferase)